MCSQLIQIEHSKEATTIARTDSTLNAVGNRTAKLSTLGSQPSTSESYTYDAIDQVTAVSGTTNATYAYDAVGNRTSVTGSVPGAGSYAANNLNQYTSAQGKVLLHDSNGNLTKVGFDWDYSYDSKNRLLSATKNQALGTTTVAFDYDNRNRQVSRTVDGVTTFYVYADWSLIAEYDASGALITEYVHGPMIDEIIAKIDTSGTVYYHHDGLGSTVALTDDQGDLIESYTYDVFGAVTMFDSSGLSLQVSGFNNRFLFTGREWIAELGLYDYRNRVYSPDLGRFLQTDPIRFTAGDVNLYRYVGNNPVNWTDPEGLFFSPKGYAGATMGLAGAAIRALGPPGWATAGGALLIAGAILTVWDAFDNLDVIDDFENFFDDVYTDTDRDEIPDIHDPDPCDPKIP